LEGGHIHLMRDWDLSERTRGNPIRSGARSHRIFTRVTPEKGRRKGDRENLILTKKNCIIVFRPKCVLIFFRGANRFIYAGGKREKGGGGTGHSTPFSESFKTFVFTLGN